MIDNQQGLLLHQSTFPLLFVLTVVVSQKVLGRLYLLKLLPLSRRFTFPLLFMSVRRFWGGNTCCHCQSAIHPACPTSGRERSDSSGEVSPPNTDAPRPSDDQGVDRSPLRPRHPRSPLDRRPVSTGTKEFHNANNRLSEEEVSFQVEQIEVEQIKSSPEIPATGSRPRFSISCLQSQT